MSDRPDRPDLAPGTPAPAFRLPVHGWITPEVSPADLAGRPLILYFYPRDATPGCTTEALDFTAALPAIRAKGAEVFGISTDSLASHARFATRQGLTVPLISDPEAVAARAYGAWVEKNLYGRTSMGVERRSVLIGADGRIRQLWPKVRVAGHVAAVLAALDSL